MDPLESVAGKKFRDYVIVPIWTVIAQVWGWVPENRLHNSDGTSIDAMVQNIVRCLQHWDWLLAVDQERVRTRDLGLGARCWHAVGHGCWHAFGNGLTRVREWVRCNPLGARSHSQVLMPSLYTLEANVLTHCTP